MYANLRTTKSGLINNFSQKNNPNSSRARVEKIQLILEITVIKIGKYLYDVYSFPHFRVHITHNVYPKTANLVHLFVLPQLTKLHKQVYQ